MKGKLRDNFEDVTLLFADIKGFTALSKTYKGRDIDFLF
jgi:hypothetical protein